MESLQYQIKNDDQELVEMRNVAGEIRGSMIAMEEALKMGKDTLFYTMIIWV